MKKCQFAHSTRGTSTPLIDDARLGDKSEDQLLPRVDRGYRDSKSSCIIISTNESEDMQTHFKGSLLFISAPKSMNGVELSRRLPFGVFGIAGVRGGLKSGFVRVAERALASVRRDVGINEGSRQMMSRIISEQKFRHLQISSDYLGLFTRYSPQKAFALSVREPFFSNAEFRDSLLVTVILMFSTLGLFRSVGCPDGQSCTRQFCLFGHRDSEIRHPPRLRLLKPSNSALIPSKRAATSNQDELASKDQLSIEEPPRKVQKTTAKSTPLQSVSPLSHLTHLE